MRISGPTSTWSPTSAFLLAIPVWYYELQMSGSIAEPVFWHNQTADQL